MGPEPLPVWLRRQVRATEPEGRAALLGIVIDEIFRYEAMMDGELGCRHTGGSIEAGHCRNIDPQQIRALRALARLYAEYPGYQQEWSSICPGDTYPPPNWGQPFLDFPTAWHIARAGVIHTTSICSYVVTDGATLCDCGAVQAEWERRRAHRGKPS